ncbi:ANTAR domain-containing protein [Streptomyces sp. NBC_01462]|uniref:ANTAR domain-containing protein n=1 Tax=Streptomyces sp. NBC_01462 TaxID=2903876 RepID=UPI002E3622BD|nr:ANTAR domain-containing protein [Streptomyces sp. NBC_01462]
MTLPRDRCTQPCPPEGEREGSLARLKAENAQLRQAVESHAAVDRAIGVLIALHRCSAVGGWEVLREVSQHTNTRLRDVADTIIGWTQGHPLPDIVRVALEDALRRGQPGAGALPGHE